MFLLLGTVILLENVRYHVEEEGKGTDMDGKKVKLLKYAHFLCIINC